jgi:tRNA modification GTPase
VSAKTGAGLSELLDVIASRLADGPQGEPALLTRQRHRRAVVEAITALQRAIAPDQTETELMAEDVRQAVLALERLIGRIGVEDILDQLFTGFCIGK